MTNDMTRGNPTRLIISFTLPVLFGNLCQQLYGMVDSIIVGRAISMEALAAVGATSGISFLVIGCIQAVSYTHLTIASQTGKNLVDVLANIAKEFPEIPVFGQVVAKDTEGMVAEARKIVTAGKNIVVKLPATREAVKAIKILHAEGIKTCATAVLTEMCIRDSR